VVWALSQASKRPVDELVGLPALFGREIEVAVAALEQSATLESADIAAALSGLNIDTVVGPVDFTSGPVPNVAKTPLTGGQWRLGADGGYELVIVVNPDTPEIPTGGTPEPIAW